MKKITFLTFFLFFLSITQAQAQPTDTETESICVSGFDSDPLTITLTPSDLTVNQGQQITAVSVSSATLGSSSYWGNWYDATITVTGGVSDGSAVTIANMAGLDLTGFTSITMTSEDLDVYSDSVTMCLNLDVTWELPTISADESVCVSGFDSDPLTITLTPSDLTVNQGQQITAVSVSSATLGSSSYWGNWYDATITVTGGVSDGSAVTIANMAGLDLTGFTSITMTSEDLDVYSDSVTMCLILGVTYVEPSCTSPSDITFSNITASSADISWTAGGSETDYEYVVQAAGTGEPVAAGTAVTGSTSVTISGLDSGTDYEIYVRSDCGDGLFSVWTGPSTFTTQPACGDTVTYCYDNGLNSVFSATVDNVGDYITVSIIEGDTESCCDDLVIYDSSDDSGNELYRGAGDLTGVSITSTTGIISVWVDADGSVSCLNPSTWSGLPSTSLVMDITCAPPPSCEAPTGITVSQITDCCADLSWTAGGSETDYEYVVQAAGTGEPTGAGTAVTGATTVSVGPYASNTEFEVYVRSNCGVDGFSSWAGPVNFTTEPAPIVPTYTNDFNTFPGEFWSEGSGALNAGPTGSTSYWLADGFGNIGTTGAARINLYSSIDEWLITPMFDLSNGTFYLNVDAAAAEYASSTLDAIFGTDDFATLMASTDGGSTWVELYRWDGSNNPGVAGAAMPEITLNNYTATSKFAFYGESITSAEDVDFFIDNFQITTTSLGIEEASISQFTYFPNPVNDVLTIKAQKAVEDITVFNMLGQVVKRKAPNTMDCTVDLSAMQSGAYFVQVSIGNTVETVRILKN